MKNRRLIVTAALLCAVCIFEATAHAQASSSSSAGKAKEDEIRQFLKLTGAGELGVQIANQMLSSLRTALPQVPDSLWKEITAELQAEFNSEKLIEMNVPIISKHYTDDEIKQLIAFYQTPLGKKVIAVTPLVAQEGYVVGAERGREVMQRLLQKLRSKGYGPPTE